MLPGAGAGILRGRSPAHGWTPAKTATAPLFRAALPKDGVTGLTFASGKVSAIKDVSSSNTMAIVGSGAQALDTGSPLNGYGYALKLLRTAATEYGRSGGPTGSADHAMIAVSKVTAASNFGAILSVGNSSGNTSTIGIDSSNKSWWGGTNHTMDSVAVDGQAWQIIGKIQRGGQTFARLNGKLVDARGVSGNANPFTDTYSVTGTNYGIGTPLFSGFPGATALLLDGIWWTSITDADMRRVEAYLALRYGFTIPSAQVVCDGDSLTYGADGSGGQVASPYPSLLASLLPGKTFTTANMGVFGRTEQTMYGSFYTDAGVSRQCSSLAGITSATSGNRSVLVLFAASNDLNGGTSAATIEGYDAGYVTTAKATGYSAVYLCTVIARGGWTTQETERQALNTYRRANWQAMGYAGLIDLAADSRLSNSAAPTYYAADAIHLKPAGYAVVAGLVASAIGGSL